jgi:hypothetical protein
MGLVALGLAIWGAVEDWRYRRKGGKRSTTRDKLLFGLALLVVGVFVATYVYLGGSEGAGPDILGHASVPIVILLFGTWELGRWRVRRNNPLPTETPLPPASASTSEFPDEPPFEARPVVASASPNPGADTSTQQVNREVGQSLDALKENLFKLELRWQAGTISEEDYARERARTEKVLRDLLRG